MKYGLMVVAALLALIVASPVSALTQDEAQQMAKSVGSTVTVVSIESTEFNAYYNSDSHEVVMIGFNNLPESWQRLIFWHEIGHSLQWQDNRYSALRARGLYELEWDADRFAIWQLANEGIDGAEINAEVFATLYQRFGYEGDAEDSHGTAVGRITRGNLNRVAPQVQA